MRVPAIAPQALAFNPSVAAQIPDVVSGVIAGPGMQVSLVNGGDVSLTNGSGSVVASAVLTAKGDVVAADVVTGAATFGSVQPGQAFGVVVTLSPVGGDIPCGDGQHVVVTLAFSAMTSQLTNVTTAPVNATLQCSVFNASQPYRFTFIDAGDGSIQVTKHRNATCSNRMHVHHYSAPRNRLRCFVNQVATAAVWLCPQMASVIPPLTPCSSRPNGCPVLFSTHGAGVDAGSPTWTGAYQPQTQAWVLLPSNRGAYGFDWQGPGRGTVSSDVWVDYCLLVM